MAPTRYLDDTVRTSRCQRESLIPAVAQWLRHERRGGAVNARSPALRRVGAERRGIDGVEHRATSTARWLRLATQRSIHMRSRTTSDEPRRSTRRSPSPATASVTGGGGVNDRHRALGHGLRARHEVVHATLSRTPPLLLVRAAHRAARSQHRSR
jgi:hypothetical protein